MSIYSPYTYLIGWSKSNKYYYGVRYAQGCNPNDFWNTYFTSSNYVATLREEIVEPDIIQIRKIFNDDNDAIAWEHKVLKRMKAHKRKEFINQACWPSINHKGMKRSQETKDKIGKANSIALKGKKWSEERRKNAPNFSGKNNPFYGKKHSEESLSKSRQTIRKFLDEVGRPPCSEKTKLKISKANKGKKRTLEQRKRMGGKRKEMTCPHCNLVGRGGAMIRYHMDNCRYK